MAADGRGAVSLVEEFVAGQADSAAADAAAGVRSGRFSILSLVEALEVSLTSSQTQTRARAVQLLSLVLHECHAQLSESEVKVLIVFYEDRLKDHYAILPHVLHGLRALAKSRVLPPGSAVSILKALFQDVHVQSLMVAERSSVYSILISLMESREEELKGLGADFVFGFVQAVDGERDPRNLVLAFRIARDIIHRGYDFSKFTEELFEVTSCYFPIDFTPPANDPHGITQEELILALRAVLTGTPRFAEFLLPLLIEKLDSDLQNSKVDAMQTLQAACSNAYSHAELSEFLPGLWSSIRREVFQTASERVESAGLSALSALTSCLSRSVIKSDSSDSLQDFLQLVLTDCKHHLCEPDLKLVWPSAKLLQAACGASYRASVIVTAAVLPALLQQYTTTNQCAQRRTLLEVLLGFVEPTTSSRPAEGEDSVLLPLQRSVCDVVFSALSESNTALQITATKVLSSLSQQTGLLTDPDVEAAVDHLTRLILQEDDAQLCSAVEECAGPLSRLHPAVFSERMLPALKDRILTDDVGAAERRRCVSALACVSTQLSVVLQSAPILLQVLSSAHTAGGSSLSVEELSSVCGGLQRMASQAQKSESIGGYVHNCILPQILGLALHAALQSEGRGDAGCSVADEHTLSALVPVVSTSCAALQSESAAQMAGRIVSLFLDGDASFLPENTYPSKIQLLTSQTDSRTRLVCLLMASVCSLPRDTVIPELDRLLGQLEDLVFNSAHVFSYTSAAKCIAGLINKTPAGPELDGFLSRISDRMTSVLNSESSAQRLQASTLLIWVTKALLLRYHPVAERLSEQLFSLLDDAELGLTAADGFCLLMSDSVDVLNRSCHADVRIMYRQRFFTENSSKLVQGFSSTQPEKRCVYLKALSHIVNNLPRQVQLSELPKLVPLLLEALACDDQAVHLSTLSSLQPLLSEPPPALTNQLESLFTRLLALTASPAMNVRMGSLRCLRALSRLPEHMVLPFRGRVIRALAVPLDDKKRLVRKEAVSARGDWFLLGSPGGR